MISIDSKNFTPIYLQIGEDIKAQILSGKYSEGDRLPSESELIGTYNVTRTTVQKALAVLVNDGLIERIHGKGTYVRLRPVRENIWNFSSFSDYAKRTNQVPITKVIAHEVFTKQKETYLKLVRLRGFKKQEQTQWLTLDTSILALSDFPGLDAYDFASHSLYKTLKNIYDTEPSNAGLRVIPILASEELVNFFHLKSPAPLLNVKGEVFNQQGKLIETVNVVYSPDADFNFVISI